MKTTLSEMLKQYDYQLPDKLIAQEPAKPRDSAKLLVYNRASQKIQYDIFRNIGRYLPKNSVLVFNQTKVVPARLKVEKASGGKAEILYINHTEEHIQCIANRKLAIGSFITVQKPNFRPVRLRVAKQEGQFYYLESKPIASKIHKFLAQYGQTPLPPYIKHSQLTERQRRVWYQSVFAKAGLSVAAPTASLHFTRQLTNQLKKQGIAVQFVTLNVNLGTFAPLREEHLQSGTLHTETYSIDKAAANFLNAAKAQGRPIIAVGTTMVRALESAAQPVQSRRAKKSIKTKLAKLHGETNIFIRDPYEYKFVDAMVTNFHVPRSSLLMLVSAMVGQQKLMELYSEAIKEHFRFFSFGDGMLIL